MAQQAPAKGAEQNRFPSHVIVVEITPPLNRQLMFAFTQSKLRGRWALSNIPGRSPGVNIANMPDIPGHHVSVNCSERTVTVTDPLGDEKNAELLARVNKIRKQALGNEQSPHPPIIRKDVSDDDLKSVLLELSSWERDGKITVHRGELPSVDDCLKLPGKRRLNPYDSNPEAPRYEGDPDLRRQQVVQMGSPD